MNAVPGLIPRLALLGALASGPVDDTGHLDAAAFAFVMPGVSRAEVDRRLGPPYISSPSVVAAGDIDLFVDEIRLDSSRSRQPRQTEEVHFYDYRPDAHPSELARIVFRQDKVWYALLPPRAGEATVESARALHGRDFVTSTVEWGSRHVRWVTRIHRIPELGVGVVEWESKGVTHRLVFPPER